MTQAADRPSAWHRARRPSRDCDECSLPWPCPRARETLAVEYRHDRTSGTFYLAACMREAIDDSFAGGGPEAGKLWERFLGWYLQGHVSHATNPREPECRLGVRGFGPV